MNYWNSGDDGDGNEQDNEVEKLIRSQRLATVVAIAVLTGLFLLLNYLFPITWRTNRFRLNSFSNQNQILLAGIVASENTLLAILVTTWTALLFAIFSILPYRSHETSIFYFYSVGLFTSLIIALLIFRHLGYRLRTAAYPSTPLRLRRLETDY